MILSDRTLREAIDAGRIVIEPFDERSCSRRRSTCASTRLFRVFRNHTHRVIDVKQDMPDLTELVEIEARRGLHAAPRRVRARVDAGTGRACPTTWSARIEGKSSLGRLGLLIHSTAGFIDAGFDGHITLELANVASLPITLYPGMKIGQISFMRISTRPRPPTARPAPSTRGSAARRRAATSATSVRTRRSVVHREGAGDRAHAHLHELPRVQDEGSSGFVSTSSVRSGCSCFTSM